VVRPENGFELFLGHDAVLHAYVCGEGRPVACAVLSGAKRVQIDGLSRRTHATLVGMGGYAQSVLAFIDGRP
jgi:hypothetical protein